MARAITTIGLLLLVVLAASVLMRRQPADAPPPIAGPGRDASEGPSEPIGPAVTAPDRMATARVWIELETTAELRPPRAPAVLVVHHGVVVPAMVDIVAGDPDQWPLCAGGTAAAGPALVRVELGGGSLYRRAERGPDGVLHLAIGVERALRGRVVDRAARPVALARIWCGGLVQDEVATDDDGRFEAMVPCGGGVPVVARAEGKAWKCTFAEVRPDVGGEVAFVLVDEVPLHVQAVGVETSLRAALVHIVPSGVVDTEMQAWPLFAQGLLAETPIDGNGSAIVRGLPRDAMVGVVLSGPAMACTRVDGVALRRAPTRVDVAIAPLPTIDGSVVDERGEPVVGAEVWCWPKGASVRAAPRAGALIPSALPALGVAIGTTGGEGAFSLAMPGDRALAVGVLGASGCYVEMAVEPPLRGPLRLVLPREVAAAATLSVPPPVPGQDWELRIDRASEGQFAAWLADRTATVALGSPFVADVRARIAMGERWSEPTVARGLVFSGDVALPLELLRR